MNAIEQLTRAIYLYSRMPAANRRDRQRRSFEARGILADIQRGIGYD